MNFGKKTKLPIAGVVRVLILVLVASPAMGAWDSSGLNMRSGANATPEAKIPEVKGLEIEHAEAKLRAFGLSIRVLAERSDLVAPAGEVLRAKKP